MDVFVVKQSIEGSESMTVALNVSCEQFTIKNDGAPESEWDGITADADDLTFTIHGITTTVKRGEVFQDVFDAFTTVTITASYPFRANVAKAATIKIK